MRLKSTWFGLTVTALWGCRTQALGRLDDHRAVGSEAFGRVRVSVVGGQQVLWSKEPARGQPLHQNEQVRGGRPISASPLPSRAIAHAAVYLASDYEYAGLGIEKVWLGPPGPDPKAWVERVTEKVVQRLRDL